FRPVWGLPPLRGPLLGVTIFRSRSCRWLFFIKVPAGIAAAALLVIALHENVEHHRHSLDWVGAGLLTFGLTALLFGAHGGQGTAIGLPLAALSLILFFFIERRSREPVVPLDLFRQRAIGVATAAGALVAAQPSVEWRQRRVATARTVLARTIGGTLAVGVLGGILSAAVLRDGTLPPGAADRLLGPEHGAGLDPAVVSSLSASL